jgi:hypothetical protein
MILVSENSTADNGMKVQSTVHLSLEDLGKVARPFFVQASVDNSPLFHAYCFTEAEAKLIRERMHASYLEVHAS